MLLGKECCDENLSWIAYHGSQHIQEKYADLSVLLPLFREDSKSAAMIKHGMDVVKQAVSHLNSQQTWVRAFEQPLFAIAKQVQRNWKELYEQDFAVVMGALHIEMVALKTLGNSFLTQCMYLFYHIYQKCEISLKVNMKKGIVQANIILSRIQFVKLPYCKQ